MKKILVCLSLAMCVSSMSAQHECEFKLTDLIEDSGFVGIEVSFSNAEPVNGMEYELTFPSNVSFDGLEPGSRNIKGKVGRTDANLWTASTNVLEQRVKVGAYVTLGFKDTEGKEVTEMTAGDLSDVYVAWFEVKSGEVSLEDFTIRNVESAYKGTVRATRYEIGKVGKNGYSSFSSTKNVIVENATAYYGVVDGDVVTLTPWENNHVTKCIINEANPEKSQYPAAILKGKEGETMYGISTGFAPEIPTMDLIGTVHGIEASNVHVLTTEDGVTGFYKYSGWIPACKAYLSGAPTNAPLRVVIEDVNGIQEVAAEDLDGVIFNLNGQKVNEVKKGIHVVNGKKVMF